MAIRTYNATELGANASISIGSGALGVSHHDPEMVLMVMALHLTPQEQAQP